uniref:Secreted protein n=1 Tax=Globodera rostochiensis TaxID=31243 RepID=A0A914I3G2_GLORO
MLTNFLFKLFMLAATVFISIYNTASNRILNNDRNNNKCNKLMLYNANCRRGRGPQLAPREHCAPTDEKTAAASTATEPNNCAGEFFKNAKSDFELCVFEVGYRPIIPNFPVAQPTVTDWTLGTSAADHTEQLQSPLTRLCRQFNMTRHRSCRLIHKCPIRKCRYPQVSSAFVVVPIGEHWVNGVDDDDDDIHLQDLFESVDGLAPGREQNAAAGDWTNGHSSFSDDKKCQFDGHAAHLDFPFATGNGNGTAS